MRRSFVLVGAVLLLSVVAPLAGRAQTTNVVVNGTTLGSLTVSNYVPLKTVYSDDTYAEATIAADFTKAGTGAATSLLAQLAPGGMTYMQTIRFNTPGTQRIFRAADGSNLAGTWSDPPYHGYTMPTGTFLTTDATPWYSNIAPSGVAGDVPPTFAFGAPLGNHQFADYPGIEFSAVNGIDGLVGLLGKNSGSIEFETALVGVVVAPVDNPATPTIDERFTNPYVVNYLADFTWGINVNYTGNGIATPTIADYSVTARPLQFIAAPTSAFLGAFDKQGANAAFEYNVVNAATAPEAATAPLCLLGLALGAGVVMRQRRPSPRLTCATQVGALLLAVLYRLP